jgi:hypothetical protein
MLVAYRLAGLFALGAHYAGINELAQSGVDEHRSDAVLDRLRAMRGPGESYSDVILRLAEAAA